MPINPEKHSPENQGPNRYFFSRIREFGKKRLGSVGTRLVVRLSKDTPKSSADKSSEATGNSDTQSSTNIEAAWNGISTEWTNSKDKK